MTIVAPEANRKDAAMSASSISRPPYAGRASDTLNYGAVIRAYQHTPLLVQVVDALRSQTIPPKEIIIVDSSHDETVSKQFRSLATTVVAYPKEEFNYAKALNIGCRANGQELTLNISSHMLVLAPDAIEAGWRAASAEGLEIISWIHHPEVDLPGGRYAVVDRRSFNGFNGMSNVMSLVPTALLKERPFREEVFAAEDREWTKYYLGKTSKPILNIETSDVRYQNPNHGGDNWNQLKLLNEELAIGYYVKRRALFPDRIAFRFLRALLATVRRRPDRAKLHLDFAWSLTKANFIKPERQSRYF